MKKEVHQNQRTETWNGHTIRFIEHNGEWWALLKDVCDALELRTDKAHARLDDDHLSKVDVPDTLGRTQRMLIVNEYGIYDTVFQSRKPEARAFRYWVYAMLKTLRESSGLAGFEVFRMLDKEHQREQMRRLRNALEAPVRVDFIKANTITNRTVSTMHGSPRMLKKAEMTPAMLVEREKVLADTVDLMSIKDRFGIEVSVSEAIYNKYSPTK
jgi:prophage antirepressor-like protein